MLRSLIFGLIQPINSVRYLDVNKIALHEEAKLHAGAPEWAKLMQSQLMQRMECIEKHMDQSLASLAESLALAREDQGNGKKRDNTVETSRSNGDNC